jgi:hypothetical protein
MASSFLLSSRLSLAESSVPGRLLGPPFRLLVNSVSMSNMEISRVRAIDVAVDDCWANAHADLVSVTWLPSYNGTCT